MSKTVFSVSFNDSTTMANNTTPVKPGNKVTVTFPGYCDFTPKDDDGNDMLFDVVEENGVLGLMYPGRDWDGDWHDRQFTPFTSFSYTVIFTIAE